MTTTPTPPPAVNAGPFDCVTVNGAEVNVYPIGIAHLLDPELAPSIAKLMGTLAGLDWTAVAKQPDAIATAIRALFPVAGVPLLFVVNRCCVPRLDYVNADAVTVFEVALRWARLSFAGEARLKNLTAAIEALAAVNPIQMKTQPTPSPAASQSSPPAGSVTSSSPNTATVDRTGG